MIHKLVRVSAKAIIQDGDRYLVMRDADFIDGKITAKYNDLPGGTIEYGENPEQALLREVKEEIGIDVKIEKFLGYWYFTNENNHFHVICLTFLCSLVQATKENIQFDIDHNPCLEEKILEIEWVEKSQITDDQHLANSSLKQLLADQLP
jgi:8-oxo-dGTP diphosphatase